MDPTVHTVFEPSKLEKAPVFFPLRGKNRQKLALEVLLLYLPRGYILLSRGRLLVAEPFASLQ